MEKMYELPSWVVWAVLVALIVGIIQIPVISPSYIGMCIMMLIFYLYHNIKIYNAKKKEAK